MNIPTLVEYETQFMKFSCHWSNLYPFCMNIQINYRIVKKLGEQSNFVFKDHK